MRAVDWVDRLAGLHSLETERPNWVGKGYRLTPMGPWLVWPKWRRLMDLLRAQVQGNLCHWRLRLHGDSRFYADAAWAIHDIKFSWRFEPDRDDPASSLTRCEHLQAMVRDAEDAGLYDQPERKA